LHTQPLPPPRLFLKFAPTRTTPLQEELDRREQQIAQLTAQNEDLLSTVEALQGEVLASNAEAERAARELDAMRQEASGESLQREQALREARAELERTRTARDDWEAEAMAQRVRAEEARITLDATYRELTGAKEACERDAAARDAEAERANNLQAVLEDFQSGAWNVPPPCRALLRSPIFA
jgi:chromosome segregation ATPase